jgi:hypothetical protein
MTVTGETSRRAEEKITVTLSDVTSDSSAVLPDTAVSMNVLASDVDANKSLP